MYKKIAKSITAITVLISSTLTSANSTLLDCNQPIGDVVKEVCAVKEIRSLVEAMDITLKQAANYLSEDGYLLLENDQTKWKNYVHESCFGVTIPEGKDVEACLASSIERRIKTLSRHKDGDTIYPTIYRGFYSVIPSSAEIDWIDNAITVITHPQVDLSALAGDALIHAAKIDAWLDQEETVFQVESHLDRELEIILSQPLNDVLTLTFKEESYGHGAAHGITNLRFSHFDAERLRQITADDIFSRNDWTFLISNLAYNYLRVQLGEDLWITNQQDMIDLIVDTNRWHIEKQRLVLHFNPYEVAAFAYGLRKVPIRWEEINNLLTQSWKYRLD